MEDALDENASGEVRLSLLYSSYKIWCRENGQYPESSRGFRRNLEQTGVHIQKKRPKGSSEAPTSMVVGYNLLSDYALSA